MVNIRTLKGQIKYCLEEFPDTRESDIRLMIKIWQLFYEEYIYQRKTESTGEVYNYVKLNSLFYLPREDNIKRVRAKFNSKGLFLPKNPEVLKKRKLLQEEWRGAMGYNPELREL